MACRLRFTFSLLASASAVSVVSHGNASQRAAGPFMIVSGISAPTEFCLTARGTHGDPLSLEPCADAVAAADGRELFTFDGGKLMSDGTRLCLSVSDELEGLHRIALGSCSDSGASFVFAGDGQLRTDGFCLSQHGPSAGTRDGALHAAASANSYLNLDHGPTMATDGRATYWASAFDPLLPVEFAVDLGSVADLQSATIDWEFPARVFAVFLSSDASRWEEVFSTDVNSLHSTRVPFGGVRQAQHVKVVMHEPHPLHSKLHGSTLFGIRRLAVREDRLQAVAVSCSEASAASDARDKYFMAAVSPSPPGQARDAEQSIQDLGVAAKSLAAALADLQRVQPELGSCGAAAIGMRSGLGANLSSHLHVLDVTADDVLGDAEKLLISARAAVITFRTALK